MKISEFAKKYGLKKSSIRYYTDIKLLNPKMNGTFYNYDCNCEKDIEDIIEYKELGFSLQDIFNIISYKRFSNPLVGDELDLILNILNKKKIEIENQIKKLNINSDRLDTLREILLLNTNEDCYGYPLECIDLLECPNCHKQLKLSQCEVSVKGIINGMASCPCCDYLITIENGILNCSKNYLSRPNRKEISNPNLQWQFIYETLNQVETKLKQSKSFWENGKIYLFNGADTEIITMALLDEVHQDKIYIFSEKSYEVLQYIKSKLEIKKIQGKFAFICHKDSIPLKKCVDRLIDIFGINMNALYSSEPCCNLKTIQSSLLPGCQYTGVYLCTRNEINNESNGDYPFYLKYFNDNYISKLFCEVGIKISSSQLINHAADFSSFFPFESIKGEHLDLISITGLFGI